MREAVTQKPATREAGTLGFGFGCGVGGCVGAGAGAGAGGAGGGGGGAAARRRTGAEAPAIRKTSLEEYIMRRRSFCGGIRVVICFFITKIITKLCLAINTPLPTCSGIWCSGVKS